MIFLLLLLKSVYAEPSAVQMTPTDLTASQVKIIGDSQKHSQPCPPPVAPDKMLKPTAIFTIKDDAIPTLLDEVMNMGQTSIHDQLKQQIEQSYAVTTSDLPECIRSYVSTNMNIIPHVTDLEIGKISIKKVGNEFEASIPVKKLSLNIDFSGKVTGTSPKIFGFSKSIEYNPQAERLGVTLDTVTQTPKLVVRLALGENGKLVSLRSRSADGSEAYSRIENFHLHLNSDSTLTEDAALDPNASCLSKIPGIKSLYNGFSSISSATTTVAKVAQGFLPGMAKNRIKNSIIDLLPTTLEPILNENLKDQLKFNVEDYADIRLQALLSTARVTERSKLIRSNIGKMKSEYESMIRTAKVNQIRRALQPVTQGRFAAIKGAFSKAYNRFKTFFFGDSHSRLRKLTKDNNILIKQQISTSVKLPSITMSDTLKSMKSNLLAQTFALHKARKEIRKTIPLKDLLARTDAVKPLDLIDWQLSELIPLQAQMDQAQNRIAEYLDKKEEERSLIPFIEKLGTTHTRIGLATASKKYSADPKKPVTFVVEKPKSSDGKAPAPTDLPDEFDSKLDLLFDPINEELRTRKIKICEIVGARMEDCFTEKADYRSRLNLGRYEASVTPQIGTEERVLPNGKKETLQFVDLRSIQIVRKGLFSRLLPNAVFKQTFKRLIPNKVYFKLSPSTEDGVLKVEIDPTVSKENGVLASTLTEALKQVFIGDIRTNVPLGDAMKNSHKSNSLFKPHTIIPSSKGLTLFFKKSTPPANVAAEMKVKKDSENSNPAKDVQTDEMNKLDLSDAKMVSN